MSKRTLGEAIREAVATGDAALAGRISDRLRHKGMNYLDTHRFVSDIAPISLRDWEALMYEAEWLEGHS